MMDMKYALWRSQFAQALDPRCHTLEWLDDEVMDGRAQFWAGEDGAIVVTVREYPAGARAVHGLVAAGEIECIKGLVRIAENWGRERGCVFGEIESTPAWGRLMRDEGYVPVQLLLQKEL